MDYSFPETSELLRIKLRELFTSGIFQAQLRKAQPADGNSDVTPQALYRLMGEAGLLAVNWPREYGGSGGGPTDLAVLAEEMARHNIPHTLHFITIQIVGTLILITGSEKQKQRFLPPMARGDLYASILLTEPDIGSDLASISATAEPCEGGWVINGRKIYNLKSSQADYGLCAVRTGTEAERYQNLSLFLIPMNAPGVQVQMLTSIAEDNFHDVQLVDVKVDKEALVGELGQGWYLLTKMFAGERSGLDYYVRGLQWIEFVRDELQRSPHPDPSMVRDLGRHWAYLDAGRWLALRVLERLEEGNPDVTLASLAKWYCSEKAQKVAWWTVESFGLPALTLGDDSLGDGLLENAYREAAGMTISGGASEVLLKTIAGSRIDILGEEVV